MSTTGHELEAVNVQGLKASLQKLKTENLDPNVNKGVVNEATCSTAAGTAAKTVTAPASFSLTSGAAILVKFTNGISVDNATLAVGSTAAKPIYYKGAALEADYVEAGDIIMLKYDGTNYNVVGKLGGRALPEVQIGGTAPTSESEIKLFVDENSDDTVEVYTKAQVNTLLDGKADTATTISGYGITDAYTKTQVDALTRHTRLTDFDLNILKQAVADQNLEKYGLKVGDYKTINGLTYIIAGLNPLNGHTEDNPQVNNVGLIVFQSATVGTLAWNISGYVSEGADDRGAGYLNSDLHYYLTNTILPKVNTALGETNIIGCTRWFTSSIDANGINRTGVANGCSTDFTKVTDCKIAALSEMQVLGGTVWSSSAYDTGEAYNQLEVFQKYRPTEIFSGDTIWLRDIASSRLASRLKSDGSSLAQTVSWDCSVAGLILFK